MTFGRNKGPEFQSPMVHAQILPKKMPTSSIEKAIAKFNIDPKQSWLIGDRARDIECGQRMGLKTILITENQLHRCQPDFVAEDLREAVEIILSD